MDIKVLGTGCARCKRLYEETTKAVAELGVAAQVTKVEKLDEIMAYKVLMTPALLIHNEVKAVGRIPSRDELTSWIASAATKG
jgi:small redox-active disulfide protein 2